MMKRMAPILVSTVMLGMLFFIHAVVSSAETIQETLQPTRDAFIRGGTNADAVYGTASTINVANYGNENGQRISYLTFSLEGLNIDEVEHATLRLYASSRAGVAAAPPINCTA